jgi:hypothetical protein
MRTRITRVLSAVAISAILVACDDDGPEADRYEATLSGSNEVPANGSDATGTAVFTDRGGEMDFSIDVQNLDLPFAAHIHAGAAGVNGGILVTLFNTGDPVADFSGRLVTGSFMEADIGPLPSAPAAISMDSLRALMRSGDAYVNVHTTAFAGGEIRGQIGPR